MINRLLSFEAVPDAWDLPSLFHAWRQDGMSFLRHDAPKIPLVLIGSFVLIRLLRAITGKIVSLQTRNLPDSVRAQKVRTLASVITSVGVFAILFVAATTLLPVFGLNLGPLLASAGIAGLAIRLWRAELVHDFINGFFILLENQYDIGDYGAHRGSQGRGGGHESCGARCCAMMMARCTRYPIVEITDRLRTRRATGHQLTLRRHRRPMASRPIASSVC